MPPARFSRTGGARSTARAFHRQLPDAAESWPPSGPIVFDLGPLPTHIVHPEGHASGGSRSGGGGRVRLGEFFVTKGLINPKQLEEALRGQLIFGGHLGTCLIEMGFIDEHTLGRALA